LKASSRRGTSLVVNYFGLSELKGAKMRVLASLTFVVVTLVSCNSTYAADFCVTPDALGAAAQASMIFTGKIRDVGKSASSGFIVSFQTETWWVGTPTPQVRVLWRTNIPGCEYFPVGDVGERYLVYADPATIKTAARDMLPEVTILNRTSKLPLDSMTEFGTFRASDKSALISARPALNRNDASKEIEVLRILSECACLSSASLLSCPDLTLTSKHLMTDKVAGPRSFECCICLRRKLRFF
jgi:hypothetical protein